MIIEKKKIIINCERGTKKFYDELKKSQYFKEIEFSFIFALAAVFGYKENKYKEFEEIHPGGFIRVETIENNTELKRLLEAIAISRENSLNVAVDKKRVYEIAETYANGGIRILYNLFTDTHGPDFDKEIENKISEMAKNNK